MNSTVKHVLLTALAICLVSVAANAQKKTMTRTEDPVILKCKDFGPVFGSPLAELSLMALTGDGWVPIPFQVDPKKPDGSYAFTNGPEASKDSAPNLDANDELVFMVSDVGDHCEGCSLPENAAAGVEIEITDPKSGAKGWAYLMRFSGNPPRSDKDYVSLEIDKKNNRTRIVTDLAVSEKESNRSTPDLLAMKGKDGKPGQNLMDKFKIRQHIDVAYLNETWDLKLEDKIITHEVAWIDGAVRVLILNRFELEVTTYITVEAPSTSVTSYYHNQSVNPITYSQPKVSGLSAAIMAIADRLTADDRMDVYIDFRPVIYGAHFFSANHPKSDKVVVDGKMSEEEKKLVDTKPTDWIAAESPQGVVVLRLRLPPQLQKVDTRLFYMDDKNLDDSPENVPGVHAIGYSMHSFGEAFKSEDDVENVEGMVINVYTYFKPELCPEGVEELLDILDHPLETSVKELSFK